MKIMIDIGHPGHVHLFRPFAHQMLKKGHQILFTCRQKEFEEELLNSAKVDFLSFGKHFNTKIGKVFGLVKFDIQMLKTAIKFKPDIFLSHGSFYSAHASFLMKKPHISLEDSGNMEQIKFYLPFTETVITPIELYENLGSKQIRLNSFHELAYLHPKYFSPDKNIVHSLGIKNGEQYALLRFISWNATHDIGQGGFTYEQKNQIVNYLSSKMKLFISSEDRVPSAFSQYLIKISPEKIHHILGFASIVVSEGATMASEAGVLGTPSIYVNSLKRCYNENQEKYGTVYNFRDGNNVLEKIKEIVSSPVNIGLENNKMFLDKIDLTSFLIWFIENYPESHFIMKKNPDYQFNFKF